MRSSSLLLLGVAGCQFFPPAMPPAPPAVATAQPAGAPRLRQGGDCVLDVRSFYGIPILQKSVLWDGNGEVDTAGVKTRCLWYMDHDSALGCGLTLQDWFLGGADAQSAEAEGVLHVGLWHDEERAVFFEATGGFMQSTAAVPPGGTEWNFTFSFGPGIDLPIGDGVDFLAGVDYHHVSNALGRDNPRNPSQNEAQIWLGMSFRL